MLLVTNDYHTRRATRMYQQRSARFRHHHGRRAWRRLFRVHAVGGRAAEGRKGLLIRMDENGGVMVQYLGVHYLRCV